MEILKEIKSYEKDFQCPKCQKGFMRPTGQAYPSNPPQYPHKCTDCSYPMTMKGVVYPYTFRVYVE